MSIASTTDRYRTLLKDNGYPEPDSQVLALAQERPSILWVFLSPLIYNLYMRLHLVGVDKESGDLVLYKVRKGFFRLIAGIDDRTVLPLDRLGDLRYSSGLLTSTLRFTDPAGLRRTLTFPWQAKAAADVLFGQRELARR